MPLVEDRELYYAFFNYHQGLATALQAAKNASPQASAALDQQMASQLGIDVKDLPAVIANTALFTQQFGYGRGKSQYAPKPELWAYRRAIGRRV